MAGDLALPVPGKAMASLLLRGCLRKGVREVRGELWECSQKEPPRQGDMEEGPEQKQVHCPQEQPGSGRLEQDKGKAE